MTNPHDKHGEGPDIGERPAVLARRDVTERGEAEGRLRESEQRHRRRARELDLLHRVRTALARELDLGAVCRAVVEAVAEAYGYVLVSAYLLEDEPGGTGGGVLALQHQVGYATVIERIPVGHGVSGRAVRDGRPVLLEDVRDDPAFLGAIEGVTSEVCVPLFGEGGTDGKALGFLNVESTGGNRLTGDDLRLLEAVGEHAGVALGRAKLHARVREAEGRYRALVECIPAAVYVQEFGEPSRTVYVSPQMEAMQGYSPEEIARDPEHWTRTLHPDDRERVLAEDRRTNETGEPFRIEYRQLAKDGRYVWVRDEAVVVRGWAGVGERRYWLGVLADVTGRKEAEERLREAEAKYRTMIEGVPAVTYVNAQEPGGTSYTAFVSPQVESVLGYTPEEYASDPGFWKTILHPEDRDRVLAEDARTGETGDPFKMEFRMIAKDGSVVWLREEGRLVRVEEDGTQAWHGVMFDITELKRTELALKESEEQYRRLVEAVQEGIAFVDAEEKITYCNPAYAGVFGLTPGALTGRSLLEFLDEEGRRKAAEQTALRRRGESSSYELSVAAADGREKVLSASGTPIADADGEFRGAVHAVVDVTGRKEAEEALRQSEERFRALVQNASDVVTVLGADGTILYESPAVERVLGHRPEELVGKDAFSYVHPDDRGRVLGAFAEGTNTPGTTFTPVEYRFRHKDGSWRWLEGIGNNLLSDPKVRGVVVNSRDVTERKEAQEELRRSEANLADAQRLARLGSFEVDLKTGRGRWSEESWRIFGLAPRPGASLTQEEFEGFVYPDDREAVRRAVRGAATEGRGFETTCRIVRPDGSERTVHARAEVVLDDVGRPALLRGTNHDVTERKALEERLVHQATHDALTGLPNRSLFSERVVEALARAGSRGGEVAVLLVDLDNFKYVNDTLGHGAGDGLLAAVAGRLRASLRPVDTVARLGGDEFAVLLENVSEAGEAEHVAERITEGLREPFALGGGREAFVTPSIGVALARPGRATPEDLLREADLALYEAKGAGKARHAVFDPAMEARVMERLELENDLRWAASDPNAEFAVRYQPIVRLGGTADGRPGDTGGRRVVGFEALLRWEHPERGLLSPDAFLPLAEELGLTVPVGRWLLGEACRRTKEWQERHPGAAPLAVGANLSARQLSDPGIVSDFEGAARGAGLDPGQVTLEVTEDAVIGDAGRHLEALRGLKDAGFLLALDDFGTGYSSLSYLRRLPVGLVKIDRSFVERIGEDGHEEDEVLLSGIVGIAHGLGLLVCAEGVESERQLGRTEEMGCDLAQGHLFSAPLEAAEASELLARGLPR